MGCIANQPLPGGNLGACLCTTCGPEHDALQDGTDFLLNGECCEDGLAVCGVAS